MGGLVGQMALLMYVAVGGATGSIFRYLVTAWIGRVAGRDFPYGTLAVNLLGSFLLGIMIGVIVTLLPRGRELHLLVAVGFLGGFTTFSAFSLDLYLLLERGQFLYAAAYATASVGLSVMLFFLGMWIFRSLAW